MMHTDTESSMLQVQYAHQFSGENSPFGCLESYNTTPALDIRLGPSGVFYLCTLRWY